MNRIILVYHKEDPNLTRKFFSDAFKAIEYGVSLTKKNLSENGIFMEGRFCTDSDVIEWLNEHLSTVE